MKEIDPRSGMGTEDPLGGDLHSHLAYIRFREEWVKKHGREGGFKPKDPNRTKD